MKFFKVAAFALVCALGFGLSAYTPSEGGEGEIEIGHIIPMMALELEDISGTKYNLRELHQENGLLVVFSCNTCPFVLQWEDRYNDLYDYCAENNIGMVLVNSNEAKRGDEDSKEAMIAKAKKEGYKMPYVIDTDHVVADAFGAKTTPHVFLFDRSAKLVYRGAIDDNGKDKEAVTEHYLMDALTAMSTDQPISTATTKAIGCSIKRVN